MESFSNFLSVVGNEAFLRESSSVTKKMQQLEDVPVELRMNRGMILLVNRDHFEMFLKISCLQILLTIFGTVTCPAPGGGPLGGRPGKDPPCR